MTERRFTNVQLADGRVTDLAVRDGRFVRAQDVSGTAETVDLGGLLALPGLVDGHIHLDKSFLGDRWRPWQPAADLRERLAVEKRLLGEALPVAERADRLIASAYARGTVAMRSHVDVDATTGLANLHAVMEAREAWRGRVDVELVAFPQAGILTCPGTAQMLDAALGAGADAIGGIDPTAFDGDAAAHLDIVFGLAGKHGAKVDIHLHEHGEGGIAQLERIAGYTKAAGLGGRVTVSHAYALGDVGADLARRTAATLAAAGVSILTNAPGDHPFPPVAMLRAEGVRIFAGSDNIRDAWWPYGDADMLNRAMLIAYRSGFHSDEDLMFALEMATTGAAGALGLDDHGIAVGKQATFVLIEADNAAAAVAAPPAGRLLVQRGEVVRPDAAPSRFRQLAEGAQGCEG
ncbi:amidohydrolase [Sphingopyxis granuli]|uniref:Cytosine deaminase n=1 Tax=Sphingopyxis granuli TaxID=267128 RepID=A0AA86GN22_9SPHN|nr:amidohydrolase [Sphingopyxis granuli]AMG75046.1 Cytosine deaminase [Sphingopyxis granuli]